MLAADDSASSESSGLAGVDIGDVTPSHHATTDGDDPFAYGETTI
jgi:hypothetical protein